MEVIMLAIMHLLTPVVSKMASLMARVTLLANKADTLSVNGSMVSNKGLSLAPTKLDSSGQETMSMTREMAFGFIITQIALLTSTTMRMA